MRWEKYLNPVERHNGASLKVNPYMKNLELGLMN